MLRRWPRNRSSCPSELSASVAEPGQGRLQLELIFGEAHHQHLTRLHLLAEHAEAIGQARQGHVGVDPALLAAGQDALQVFQAVGGLLEKAWI